MPQILVIDDDVAMQVLLERTLKRKGYQVITASDGKVGLEMAIAHQPDLIISDWMMPGMDGIAVCKAVKNHLPPHLSQSLYL